MTRARDLSSILAADGSLNISTSVNLADNEKAYFGTSNDLQIYHDGLNSYIHDNGTGDLFIRGSSNVYIQNSGGGSSGAQFVAGGAANINYAGATKLATTSTGVDVTGTVNITGDGDDLIVNSADYELVLLGNRGSSGVNLDQAYLRMKAEGVNTIALDTAGSSYFNGGNVGIGTTAPDLALHVEGTNGAPASSGSTPTGFLSLRQKDGGASHGANIGVLGVPPWGTWIQGQDANNLATSYPLLLNPNGGNVGIGTSSPSDALTVSTSAVNGGVTVSGSTDPQYFLNSSGGNQARFKINDASSMIQIGSWTNIPVGFYTNGTERMRIQTGGFTLNPATSNLYTVSGTLSYWGTTNNVYLNGASSGGMIMSGNGNRYQYVYLNSVSDSVMITTNTVERLGIDSSGRVTMPYQPGFSVRQLAQSGINCSSSNYIAFRHIHTTNFNTGNHFSSSTGSFTAPVAGNYIFGTTIRYDGFSGSYFYVTILKNGTGFYARELTSLTGSYLHASVHTIMNMAAGDYCNVALRSVGDSNIGLDGDSNFYGYLLG